MSVVLESSFTQISSSIDDASGYGAARAAHLANAVGQPGFDEAVRAERDNVALRIGILGVNNTEEVEARLAGVLHGALRLGAALLA